MVKEFGDTGNYHAMHDIQYASDLYPLDVPPDHVSEILNAPVTITPEDEALAEGLKTGEFILKLGEKTFVVTDEVARLTAPSDSQRRFLDRWCKANRMPTPPIIEE